MNDPASSPKLRITRTIVRVVVLITVVLGPIALASRSISSLSLDSRLHAAAFSLDWALICYPIVFVAALTASVAFGDRLVRENRNSRSAAIDPRRLVRLARGLAVSLSIVVGLLLLEIAAGVLEFRFNRFPELPRFNNEQKSDVSSHHPSSPQEIDLVVLGESSAAGEPYSAWLSLGRIVAWRIERSAPGIKVRLHDLATGGANLRDMHQKLAQLKRKPDIIIIYSGHNEYQSRYEWSREVYPIAGLSPLELLSHPRALSGLAYRIGLKSPLCRLIYGTKSKMMLDRPPPPATRRRLIDVPPCSPSESEAILVDFRRRLEAIVAYCKSIGATPILISPSGNDAGFEPNRTVLGRAYAEEQEIGFIALEYQRGRTSEKTSPRDSLDYYTSIFGPHRECAEVLFRSARVLRTLGDVAEARRRFILARDLDGFPLRAISTFQQVYRIISKAYDATLIDSQKLFESMTDDGILDDRLFIDAQHPVLAGHVALADAVLAAPALRERIGLEKTPIERVNVREVAEHFGVVGRDAWFRVAMRAGLFYEKTADIRFDPSERRAKAARLLAAARAVAAGTAPESLGIHGLGVPSNVMRSPNP
jgi:hypothetical protein